MVAFFGAIVADIQRIFVFQQLLEVFAHGFHAFVAKRLVERMVNINRRRVHQAVGVCAVLSVLFDNVVSAVVSGAENVPQFMFDNVFKQVFLAFVKVFYRNSETQILHAVTGAGRRKGVNGQCNAQRIFAVVGVGPKLDQFSESKPLLPESCLARSMYQSVEA